MGRGLFHHARRARRLGSAGLRGASAALLLLAAGCVPQVKVSNYTFDLPRLDQAAGADPGQTTLIDLHELFLSDERIVYGKQEIPARFEEVRVTTIDGAEVPETAGYGEISPGRYVFRLSIKTTFHQTAEQSLAISNSPSGQTLQTQELVSERKLTLDLRPGTVIRFGRDGRLGIIPLAESIFGPEGVCRREGPRNRLCRRCTREGATANCIKELHYGVY